MLRNRYQEILVGLNLMSLVRGIISLKRSRTTLLIHDSRFSADTYPQGFLSELEILSLIRLGKKYDIPELSDIREFLTPASISLVSNQCRVVIGSTPFENLRELLRKYPELIDASDLDLVYQEGERDLGSWFIEEATRFEKSCYDWANKPKGLYFELQGPRWIKQIYQRFGELLNQEYTSSQSLKFKGLLHALGVLNEEKLKVHMNAEEIPYYFLRLLSPVYRLQDYFLMTQLKRRLAILGGDFKESQIQYWQLHNHKFENLLLASFEGVISGDRVLFFSHLPVEVPFTLSSQFPFYRKTQMSVHKRVFNPYPSSSLTLLYDLSLLGSESPYRTYSGNVYEWPYPEIPGSKAEFYDRALKESFKADMTFLPFTLSEAEPRPNLSVSLDLRGEESLGRSPAPILGRLKLDITQDEKAIEGFEYWGSFKYRSLGLLALSYGIEGN